MPNFDSIIIDHLNIGVSDATRSKAFYERALAPLGMELFRDIEGSKTHSGKRIVGFHKELGRPVFWLVDQQTVGTQTHIAFHAQSRDQVDKFHEEALKAGGKDNGAPGVRSYHPNYYGAFVLDPDGINLEVVCHDPD